MAQAGSAVPGGDEASGWPETVVLTEFTANLVHELSERDDDADWEIEDWSKPHVLSQLRLAPTAARCMKDGQRARLLLCPQASAAGAEASVIDLSPGISGHFSEDGKLHLLEFDLTNSRAGKRFGLVTARTPSSTERDVSDETSVGRPS
mmetsp:Transcript_55584/g.115164  ORF Transcript_55584/g.115164 Transcript_55584/m.115164 type:complete len:149 (+) Transcript_55584:65-511(+)